MLTVEGGRRRAFGRGGGAAFCAGTAIKATALTVGRGAAHAGRNRSSNTPTSLGCDLLVKSAYTQSRLRQMIFGGATRHILANATLPVLMAH